MHYLQVNIVRKFYHIACITYLTYFCGVHVAKKMRFKKGDSLMVSDIQTNRIDSAQSLLVLSICTGKNYEKHASLVRFLFNYRSLLTSYD